MVTESTPHHPSSSPAQAFLLAAFSSFKSSHRRLTVIVASSVTCTAPHWA